MPRHRVTNETLCEGLDSTPEWIESRTGIRERRFIGEEETVTGLAVEAGREAMVSAGTEPEEITLVVAATMTSERTMPALAYRVAGELGLYRAVAMDINSACTGFIHAMLGAKAWLEVYGGKALVVGAEALSRVLDFTDRETCILFGDGAGAMVLGEVSGTGIGRPVFLTLPDREETLTLDAVPGSTLKMKGRDVFRFAVKHLPKILQEVLEVNGWREPSVDLWILHQANARILSACCDKMDSDENRWFMNLSNYGNTSAASIPLAFAEAVESGRLKRGMKTVLAGFGGGLGMAATVLEY